MAYYVIIVGNGPAGLSAALYTSRAKLQTLVIGKDNGALTKADKIENYFGMAEPVSGCELVENTKRQAKTLGAELTEDEIFHISWNGSFRLEGRKETYEAKAVLLATGTSRKTADVPGLSKLEGRGVSYCAICDAFFYRGKDVAVLGQGEYALEEARVLLPLARSVTLLTDGSEAPADLPDGLRVETRKVSAIEGDELVSRVAFAEGESLRVSGVFIAYGTAGSGDFARKLGAPLDGTRIKVNADGSTAVPGLFAAGDCTGGLLQVAKAVADGAEAAMSAVKFVRK